MPQIILTLITLVRQWFQKAKIDFKRLIKVLVISGLICYTTYTVFEATRKLKEGKIGTLYRKINLETVKEKANNF